MMISTVQGDISSADSAAGVFSTITASCSRPLSTIMHASGSLDPAIVANISCRSMRGEFSGKVFGVEHVLSRTIAEPVGAIKLFSSLAAFSGSGGQGSYASANAVLDSCACSLQVYMNPLNPVHRSSPQTLSHVCVAPTVANVHLLPAPICLSNTTALFAVQ